MRADWIVIASAGLALVGFVLARFLGWAAEWFAYPSLAAPSVDLRALAVCLLLFTPVVVWRRRA